MNKYNVGDDAFSDGNSDCNAMDVNALLLKGSVEINDDLEMQGSAVLLHHSVESVTPESLTEMLTMITKVTPDIMHGPKGSVVCVNTPYGRMIFTNQDPLANWNGDEPDQSVSVGVAYKFSTSPYVSPEIQADINRTVLSGRVVINSNNELEYRTTLGLRGGRSVENVLWDIIAFGKEASTIRLKLMKK